MEKLNGKMLRTHTFLKRAIFSATTWQFEQKFRKLMFVALGAAFPNFQCIWYIWHSACARTQFFLPAIFYSLFYKLAKKCYITIWVNSKMERHFYILCNFFVFSLVKWVLFTLNSPYFYFFVGFVFHFYFKCHWNRNISDNIWILLISWKLSHLILHIIFSICFLSIQKLIFQSFFILSNLFNTFE